MNKEYRLRPKRGKCKDCGITVCGDWEPDLCVECYRKRRRDKPPADAETMRCGHSNDYLAEEGYCEECARIAEEQAEDAIRAGISPRKPENRTSSQKRLVLCLQQIRLRGAATVLLRRDFVLDEEDIPPLLDWIETLLGWIPKRGEPDD